MYKSELRIEICDIISPATSVPTWTERIHFVFTILGQGSGFSVSGRVDSGHVQVGDIVLILPAQETVSIKCKYVHIPLHVCQFVRLNKNVRSTITEFNILCAAVPIMHEVCIGKLHTSSAALMCLPKMML